MECNFTNDEDVIIALKNAENDAFRYLIDTYHERLCMYVFGLSKDLSASEDIVQNVYLKFWKRREKFKNDLTIKSYLYKSVYHEFIDYYRKRKTIQALEKVFMNTLLNNILDEEWHFENQLNLLNREIENLPPRCKQTFLLSKEKGYSNKQIAAYLNVSIKCVEAHITKAFFLLRKRVG